MTETDSTKRPLKMPERFLPQLEKYRVYQMMKDMVRDIIIHLPKDHLKQMKIFATRHMHTSEASRIIMLIEPGLELDVVTMAKQMIKDFGCFVITRRCVMDRYEKHDEYVPGCVCPTLMSEVTKSLTQKEPVPQAGWLMFDHPCTVREARCLQQDGVLPTVTLVLMRTPGPASQAVSNHTERRNFFQQDFEGLKFVYKATLKEVHLDAEDDTELLTMKCFNAVRAHNAGQQGPKQGMYAIGAPGVFRVLLIGPRGSGRSSQAKALAKNFGLVFLHYDAIFDEAAVKDDEVGQKIRKFGTNMSIRSEVIRKRLLQKDCLDHGWVMTGYPTNGNDFENLESMPTPPNRVIFINSNIETCRQRTQDQGYDWCTGKTVPMGSGPRVIRHPDHDELRREYEWDVFFTESLAELRAAAGLSAVEIDGNDTFDNVQTKVQAAVMSTPHCDIEFCTALRNVCAD
nr:adenylate kinase 8-like [Helicoverpa armigera]